MCSTIRNELLPNSSDMLPGVSNRQDKMNGTSPAVRAFPPQTMKYRFAIMEMARMSPHRVLFSEFCRCKKSCYYVQYNHGNVLWDRCYNNCDDVMRGAHTTMYYQRYVTRTLFSYSLWDELVPYSAGVLLEVPEESLRNA